MSRVTAPPFAELECRFGERLVRPGDPRYDSARAVWNGMVDKRPAAIARCGSADDVGAAVRSARDAGLPLSVRGGGHQIAGAAVVEGGLVLDMSPLRSADVVPEHGTVTVGGGALLGDLDRACARYGLAVPAGLVSHTGIGGLTLGGGIGWLSTSRGLTCDNLLEVEIVTAEGDTLTVGPDAHPELFWALRGAGANFGVVTRFIFRARPLAEVVVGHRNFPLHAAAGALAQLGDAVGGLPRELAVLARLQRVGGAPGLTVEWVWTGGVAGAESGVGALGIGGEGEVSRVRRFAEVQSRQDHRFPHGGLYYLKPTHLAGLGQSQIEALIYGAADLPAGDPQIEVLRLGGAVADVDQDASAFPRRSAAFGVNVAACWTDPADTEAQFRWARRAHAVVEAEGTGGAYLNFVGTEVPDLEVVFGRTALDRLRRVKREYDPDDVFQPAAHITPT
jgi:FAD/FMN-containing dehydrogenase